MSNSDSRTDGLVWEYDRPELIADGIIHAIGITLGLVGVIVLVAVVATSAQALQFASVLSYTTALLAMLGLSAAYNMWPVSPVKWILRRLDHSAIYLLIAGTYTPFIAQMKSGAMSAVMFAGVWLAAIAGMTLKLALPGRLIGSRLSSTCCWAGAARSHTAQWRRRSRAPPYGCLQQAERSTQSASCSTRGRACAFRMRSGTASCCSARCATTSRSSTSSCAQPRRAKPGAASAEFCGYLAVGRRRWRIFSRTSGSFCATTRIEVYSSTERPWSVTAFTSAVFASEAMRSFSAGGAAAICC